MFAQIVGRERKFFENVSHLFSNYSFMFFSGFSFNTLPLGMFRTNFFFVLRISSKVQFVRHFHNFISVLLVYSSTNISSHYKLQIHERHFEKSFLTLIMKLFAPRRASLLVDDVWRETFSQCHLRKLAELENSILTFPSSQFLKTQFVICIRIDTK